MGKVATQPPEGSCTITDWYQDQSASVGRDTRGRVPRTGDKRCGMKPYYADDQVTLYHGDCLEIDAWLEADVLVTDPPYGIGWKLGSNPLRSSSPHDGIANDQDTAVRDAALAAWCDDRPSIVFGSFRAPKPWDVKQTLVWKKPVDAGVVGSTTGYRSDIEPGRCARCHHPRGDHGGYSNLIFCYAHDAYHPSGNCDCPEYEEAPNA